MSSKLPTVAIVGRANAGKSSLFNRLVRAKRAIVAREAGTTRDSVSQIVAVNLSGELLDLKNFTARKLPGSARAFRLVDTAGLKNPADDFEATIQEQIADASAAADVILLAVDRTENPDDALQHLARQILKSKKSVLLLLNKSDLKTAQPTDEFRRLGIQDIFEVSAEHSTGLNILTKKLAEILPAARPDLDADVLKIALIGRPNVGKSSLFNALGKKQQAIVANLAGTTRDVNRLKIKFKGQTLEILDTAGMRRPSKIERGIEKFSVLRATAAIDEADVCLLLMDARELNTQLDQKLAGLISDAGKGLIIAISKWDLVEKDSFTRDAVAPKIQQAFDFVPWAPLIFTSSLTGQNVTKIFELAQQIQTERLKKVSTRRLNDALGKAILKHPPAGLKNTHPKFRYVVQTDTRPPWFVIYGSNFKFIHWSYKRYIERVWRENFGFDGTPIRFSFRDEKQMKS
ncbi:MAG: ribosome biogenesis GTPase Der [Candidatus Nomurabacteria bacterium]|jgi:GTP-binding protein|nr:ribosome biogenesis GTPase Der [Candidatus Nomurabacteria bacterium]